MKIDKKELYLKKTANCKKFIIKMNKLYLKIVYKTFSKKIKNINKRFENFQYTYENFNPNMSRYALNSKDELKFSDLNSNRNKIPKYLTNDGKSQKEKEKYLISGKRLRSGKKMKVPKLFSSSKEPLEETKPIKNLKEANTQLVPLSNNIQLQTNQTSITRYDENYINQEKLKRKNEVIKLKTLRREERNRVFNTENLIDFQNEERLSKRLTRLGVCSRRQAEKLINLGMVKVDGNVVDGNVPVTDKNHIQIYSEKGYKTPINQNTRIWIYYKPVGYICNKKDELNRPSIYRLLENRGLDLKHFVVIGNLDINSEGLLLITNNGDIAQALNNNSTLERAYKVRVFGRMFDEKKLDKIRNGVTINMKKIRFWAEVIRKQSTNTWLHIKATNNSIIDIRNMFRKLSLRVNRIIRIRYGPFTLENSRNPNDISETTVPKNVNNYLYYYYKDKVKEKLRKLDDTKIQSMKEDIIHLQRIQKKVITKKEKPLEIIEEKNTEKKSVLLIDDNKLKL